MTRVALIYPDSLDIPELESLLSHRIQGMIDVLQKTHLSFETFKRSQMPQTFHDFKLVIAAGGDGTQLDAAMRLTHTPLCPVRLLPEKSVGFLCKLDFNAFPTFIQQYLEEKTTIAPVARLQCLIDGYPIPTPILNDVLLAHQCPARATRFEITIKQNQAKLCCSGIWIATQPGSYGAARSAGATPLPPHCYNQAVYCVRECGKYEILHGHKFALSDAFCVTNDLFHIVVQDHHSKLYLDGGLEQHSLRYGQTVTFQRHRYDLMCVY